MITCKSLWWKYPPYKTILPLFINNSLTSPQTKKHTLMIMIAMTPHHMDPHTMVLMTQKVRGATDKEEPMEANGPSFQTSEEGEAVLEATFVTSLDYMSRKSKVTKYGILDTIWLMCPELSSVPWPHCLNML